MKCDIRCVEGRRMRHDPQHDDPELEVDVGECEDCGGKGCEAQANLYAAAPEMLALLKLALGDTEYVLSQGFWDEVRAAIAKAEGAP